MRAAAVRWPTPPEGCTCRSTTCRRACFSTPSTGSRRSTRVLSQAKAEALEALTDDRIGTLPAGAVPGELGEQLEADGLLALERRDEVLRELERRAVERRIEWAARRVSQSEVLSSFAHHLRHELHDSW